MTQTTMDYASELVKTPDAKDYIGDVYDILETVPAVRAELEDQNIALETKHVVIDRIFPKNIRSFLKLLCDNHDFHLFDEIRDAFLDMLKKPQATDEVAELIFVTEPTDEQLLKIRDFLGREFNNKDMEITLKQDASLKSGFIIRVGSKEFDWSEKGRINQLKERLDKAVSSGHQSESEKGIISILKSTIEEFELEATDKEIGVATWVGDGIVNVDGIDHANYGEIVIFDCGVKGMVQDVRRDDIGVILFGTDTEIHEGSRVVRTGKMAGTPVGEEFLGRVVDALGSPIDGGAEIDTENYRPIETPAPGIVDRKSVSVPMETGILSIDSMFPIGRGQRELIIGDRQTGKTSIALDTILNQKGKDVICVYVAIGQKASTIAKLVGTLKNAGAMDYT
ncbi:MAG: ATP synthase F1 subunit delta, partial [Eubacterium sp.]|nr:ATP synthase F1 subunit delta [Eubacterium sp.]